MSKLFVTRIGDAYVLKGAIDEDADFGPVQPMDGRLKLDLSAIDSINSRGVAVFRAFMDSWGNAKVEYHACSIVVLDSLIMLPMLLGPEENSAKIVSFHCAYDCLKCKSEEVRLLRTTDLSWKDKRIVFPTQPCKRCKAQLQAPESLQDVVALWEVGALAIPGRTP